MISFKWPLQYNVCRSSTPKIEMSLTCLLMTDLFIFRSTCRGFLPIIQLSLFKFLFHILYTALIQGSQYLLAIPKETILKKFKTLTFHKSQKSSDIKERKRPSDRIKIRANYWRVTIYFFATGRSIIYWDSHWGRCFTKKRSNF